MKRYYKTIVDGCILTVGTGADGEEITQEEYENIFSVIRNRPAPEDGYDYRLRADLTWELVETAVIPAEQEEISAEEALDIILGGEV